jgi:hypothetical protein
MAMPRITRLVPRNASSDTNIDECRLPPPARGVRGVHTSTGLEVESITPSPELSASRAHKNKYQQSLYNMTRQQRLKGFLDCFIRAGVSGDDLSGLTFDELEAVQGLIALKNETNFQPKDIANDTLSSNTGPTTTTAPSSSFPTQQQRPEEPAWQSDSDQQRQVPIRRSSSYIPPPAFPPFSVQESSNCPSSPILTPQNSVLGPLNESPSRSSEAPSSRSSNSPVAHSQQFEYKKVITTTEFITRIQQKLDNTTNQKSINEQKLASDMVINGTAVQDRCMECRLEGLPCFFRDLSPQEEQNGGNQGRDVKNSKAQKQRCAGCVFRHIGGCERVTDVGLPDAERAFLLKREGKKERAKEAKIAREVKRALEAGDDDEGMEVEDAIGPKPGAQ